MLDLFRKWKQMAQVQLRGVDRREHFVNKVKEALSSKSHVSMHIIC